jgi:F-type H+-transporting ATPase subunit a
MVHFNWTQLIPGVDHHSVPVVTAAVAGTLLISLSLVGRMALGKGAGAIIPAGHFSIKGFFEVFVEFIIGLTDLVMGENGRKYAPLFASLFFYLWINNLIGLVPGMTPATDNLNTTIAIGIFTFLVYNFYGFKEHGIGYIKQFWGPIMFIGPMMLVLELISHIMRPFSLGLRLYGNMMGDHTVLSLFLDLAPWWLPIPTVFYCLGIFVCTMQAFVFTLLTMIYISMAISHDH